MLTLSEHASRHPKFWFRLSGALCLLLILLAAAPTLSPTTFSFLNPLHIDTDPENMLREDEPVRVTHNHLKQEFSLYDVVVVGVINRDHPQGVFNARSLKNVYDLAAFARGLRWEENGSEQGVVGVDLMAPSTVDNIEQAGLGTVRFEWLMPSPPVNDAAALQVAEKAMRIPMLRDTLVSSDQKALALYVPITSKDISYQIAEKLRAKVAEFDSNDEYHITGLPVAQDQFGVEMFKQMAISAPLAMLLIFLLMWWFFRHLRLVLAPLAVAMISVILTMGLLVVTGNTVHIMSSMIPIFVMPIAVLDAVHILSDFFDRYPRIRDRNKTIREVMEELSAPMLYTSITTCAGFASLAFTPIPPVQVFGVFVSIGVGLAWLLTVTLVPAYIMLMPENSLQGFGMNTDKDGEEHTALARFLHALGRFTYRRAKLVLVATLLVAVGAGYGISKIQINDNPVKWFAESHPIRVADQALNERFAGTYMAYLALQPAAPATLEDARNRVTALLNETDAAIQEPARALISGATAQTRDEWLREVQDAVAEAREQADTDALWDAWDALGQGLDAVRQSAETFKQPETLAYIETLQKYLQETGLVGKSNALPDIVKTVHRELMQGDAEAFRIPASAPAVGQTLITYQSSHRPQDLWRFVTPDYRNTNLWIQLKSGDNKDMAAVVAAVDRFFAQHLAPTALKHEWFGLTYINVVWQEKMVSGMLEAFLGSFLIVLAMMAFLFRSLWWGLLSMLPLTVTIGAIYGVIGWIGKDYDMPVAVLSALSLGLAVDYAIHFLARSRFLYRQTGSWRETVDAVFGEPARAITRNVIVIGVGFLPLLAAPLIPYQTVGVFISSILLFAGVATLLILPALLTAFDRFLFKNLQPTREAEA
ncbi:MMPL family transporter [Hahella sp. CR1]|uniref:efflux RND transporter permease subunit n=1 Tax=Hahella sp. CR1 TaxID=2992807 RepID=UPI0024437370|nr:MMPL family transporter [Hahella sp. CR1]MDG9671159.1 MMPL family transporter [Hahella sp. CR1]